MRLLFCLALCLSAVAFAKPFRQPSILVSEFTDEGITRVLERAQEHVDAGAPYLVFNIDSWGGSVFSGLDLIKGVEQLKRRARIPTVCIVDVKAFSMAYIFLQSLACDSRYMTKRALLLVHGASTKISGNAETVAADLEFLRALNDAMAEVGSARLKISLKEYKARIPGKDWTMGWRAALKVGAIDGVVDEKDLPLLDN